MEVIYVIVAIVVVYWLYKGYKWIEYKNKYPILSAYPPAGILESGCYVTIGNRRYEYLGVDTKHGDILFVFRGETLETTFYNKKELFDRLDSVYGRYGLKWKKV